MKLGPRQPAQSDKRVSLTLGSGSRKVNLTLTLRSRHFSGGWHRLDVRAVAGEKIVGQAVVEHFGIGEVFVIAGQSNSANHGEEKQKINIQKVSTFDGKAWRIADDPQPGASGQRRKFYSAICQRVG